ncbi:helix-turn-helix transcriptional regulator [Salmonella enterica]|nr:helix-turn-helix transcriptional regulator [Salmonella enterica]
MTKTACILSSSETNETKKMLKDVLRERRMMLKMKQSEVAEKIGVKTQTYMKWENGIYEPKISYVSKIAKALSISEKEICEGKIQKELKDYGFIDFIKDIYFYKREMGDILTFETIFENIADIEKMLDEWHEAYKTDKKNKTSE